MLKNCCLFLLALIFVACGTMQHVGPERPSDTAIPTLSAFTDTGVLKLKIVKLDVKVNTVGNVSQTVFDLTFFNSTDRVLEGEFDFPLLDGQNISKYALEVNGEMREGVVVEKAKARVAYENTVRRGIDPGLVEKTKGNNFRTRIYPIPAKGTKRVIIGIDEILSYTGDGYVYRLPLYTKDSIDVFSLEAKVTASPGAPLTAGNELEGFGFRESGNEYNGDYVRNHFVLNHYFGFVLPFGASSEPISATEKWEDKTYCYANAFTKTSLQEKKKPATIAVLWDISSSAKSRNEQKEKELLTKFLDQTGSVKLILVPFNIATQDHEIYEIVDGKTSPIINRIGEFEKEGGTQLGAIDLTSIAADEYLVFSDGISTFGRKEIRYRDKPVTTVNSSPSADLSYLKFIAQKTNGRFIDLVKEDPDQAVKQMQTNSLHIVKHEISEGDVSDLVFRPQQNSLGLACILKTPKAVIDVYLGYDENNITEKKRFILKQENNRAENVKRIWASMKIEEMDLEYEKNKEQVTALGKKFAIVTRNTSLLVLDRIEDYVEYEIIPPTGMQKEYYALLKEKQSQETVDRNLALDEALNAMQELKAWWNKEHRTSAATKSTLPVLIADSSTVHYLDVRLDSAALTGNVEGRAPALNAPPATYHLSTSNATSDDRANSYSWGFATAEGEVAQSQRLTATDADGVADGFDMEVKNMTLPEPRINVQEWSANAGYIKRLKAAQKEDRINAYLQAKKEFGTQPAFYADAANFFYTNDDKALALLILSNIAEMKLEDPELLRTMGYHLMDMGEFDLAIETFKDVKEMREEEPQSYRDLALAYNEAGDYNEALLELNAVLKGTWDGRFGRVKSIALTEMNAIISAHNNVDVSAIDPRFIYAMPVDVRIVIGWSANNADIDLWVTDPRKEKCYYQHKETEAGGRISDDMTQGYGPEEFMIRKANRGRYVVEANLFGDHRQTLGGPLTITAELFTDFGKPTQKRRTINFRVTENAEVVKVGELSFER